MNVPMIRLKGYEGEWCSKELGRLSNSFSGGTPAAGNPAFYGGDIPFIRSGEINDSKTALFLTQEGLENSSAKIVEKDTILYALYGATSGEVGISNIRGAINQAILAIIPSQEIDKRYLAFYLRAKKDIIISTLLQGGQGNLSGALVKGISICYPKLFAEQSAIGSYISSLDNLIQSSSKKLESLKQTKEACLQSMFPQEGETTPRVRFGGFEGEWSKMSLNECLEICNERNTRNEYGKEHVLSVSDDFGVMNQIKLLGRSYAGASVANYKVVRKDQIIYTKSPLKAKPYGIVKVNKGDTGIISVLYAVYNAKTGVCPDFIHYYFEPCFRINKYLLPLINKGAKNTMNISDETALMGDIEIPSYEEQKKVAEYLQSLDSLIASQTKRLEKLKQIKSACLDKMFV